MLNKEMEEMDKVFNEFSKSCDNARKACQDFINMDINKGHTYELWFLGDSVGEPLPKNRASLEALLREARQMLTDAAAVGGVVGEAEIVHRWDVGPLDNNETVWSMSLDEFNKKEPSPYERKRLEERRSP